MIPHHLDNRTTPISDCRYWTEVREIKVDRHPGEHRIMWTYKAELNLETQPGLVWYQLPLNLKQVIPHGLLDFVSLVRV